jgi:deazaflavin-dependent oxidoreductase (nitroreductase family)
VALAPGTWPRPLLHAIRIFNKFVLNPVMSRRAGRRNSHAAALRHVGRKSGNQYSTPVAAERVPDGFLIPLAYGSRVDWLQNVMAAGRTTLAVEGQTHEVTEPQVIDAAMASALLSQQRGAGLRAHRHNGLSESHGRDLGF